MNGVHECEWGAEYHTHYGHETLGAHVAHWDCIHCGRVRSASLGTDHVWFSDGSAKRFWVILPERHKCSAGWRGTVIYSSEYGNV